MRLLGKRVSEDEAKTDELFNISFGMKMVYFCGFVSDWCKTKRALFLHRLLGWSNSVACLVLSALSIAALYTQDVDLATTLEVLSLAIPTVQAAMKASVLLYRGAAVSELARRLRRPLPLVPAGLAGAAEQRRAVQDTNRRVARITRIIAGLSFGVFFTFDILTYLYGRLSGKLIFSAVVWHYMDITKFPGYDVEMIVAATVGTSALLTIMIIDLFVFYLFLYVSLQLKLVNIAISTVLQRAQQILARQLGGPEGAPDSGESAHQNMIDAQAEEMLKDCARQQAEILEFASQVQEIFNITLLAQVMTYGAVICVNLFAICKNPTNVYILTKVGSYTAMFLCDLYLFCNFGEQIRYESQELSLACYNCGWYEASTSFARTLIIMMIRSLKPVVFSAGGVYDFTLENYVNVVRGSYSICTLLLSVEEEEEEL